MSVVLRCSGIDGIVNIVRSFLGYGKWVAIGFNDNFTAHIVTAFGSVFIGEKHIDHSNFVAIQI